jgi:hypothetical protein
MNRTHGDWSYISAFATDHKDGFDAIELHRTRSGQKEKSRVARVIFWDTLGQSYLEMFVEGLPLEIVEELIQEAKETIKIR